MRNKLLIVVVILVVIAGFWLYQNQDIVDGPKTVASPDELNSERIEKDIVKSIDEDLRSVNEDPVSQPSASDDSDVSDDTTQQVLNALEDRKYSNDSFVELQSLASEYSYCNGMVMDFKLKKAVITERKTAQLDKLNKKCDGMSAQYPFLSDISTMQKAAKELKKLPSSTELGDFFREEDVAAIRADFTAYFNEMTAQGVKGKNSQLLVQAASIMNQPFFKIDQTIAEVLGGLDENYIRQIQNNTMSLLSCEYQGGISCQPDAQIMIDKCLANELFCDINFMDWYQLYTTDAQKQDVETLLAHYRSL